MADITTNYGKVTVDNSLIPYMRENEVEFVAHNLMPYKLAKIFFDDVAVNQFCQASSRILLDSKKIIALSRNNATTVVAGDIVYQGSANTVNTFNAIVDTFFSANSTIIIRRLQGEFDDQSQLFIESNTYPTSLVANGVTYANCNVVSVVNSNTADSFYPGEGVIAIDTGNAFSTVVGTSGDNILYLNQNYLNLNVSAVGGNNIASMSNDYKVGDIVYQTLDGSPRYDGSTFRGVVYYFNVNGQGALAVKPLQGRVNVNASYANSRIWNASTPTSQPLAVVEFNKQNFVSNNNIRSVKNTNVKINVSSFVHRSGLIANNNPPNANVMILQTSSGNNPSNGNLIYFVTGTGIGTVRLINRLDGEIAFLNSALTFNTDTTTHYTVGNFEPDMFGTVAGMFQIPSLPNFKFKTGDRILTITDTDRYNDPDYVMRAAAVYSAGGVLSTKQRIQTTPTIAPLPPVDADSLVRPQNPSERTYNEAYNKAPITNSTASQTPRIPLGDGLSQTFYSPKPASNDTNYGIFVTSIDLFFKSKPAAGGFFTFSKLGKRSSMQLPITVKIAEVVNGYPTKNYLAQKTIQCKDVNISDLPSTSNTATLTKFTFDDPVYLQPATEYAITVQSDSPDYELYIAELGENVLGATPARRISEQPYAGLLFRSQNSSTWSPYQNQDLMFVINKAVFNNSGTGIAQFNLEETPTANGFIDRVMLVSTDLTFPAANVQYNLKGIYAANTAYEAGSGLQLVPNSPIEYGLVADSSGKTKATSNRRQYVRGNANSMVLTTTLATSSPDVSPIVNLERLAVQGTMYYINNGGISNTLISVTNPGSGYNATSTTLSTNIVIGSSSSSLNNYAQLYRQLYLANNANVGFYSVNVSGGMSTSNAYGFAVANTDGANTVDYVHIVGSGVGFLETPTITIAKGNATSNVQATAMVNGETDAAGGNMMARYISRVIVLEDGFESGDLRVFMDAIRPGVTDIQVYYKVLSADDPDNIASKRWRRMEKLNDVYSKDGRTLIGLEFRPSLTENRIAYTENGKSYPIGGMFKSFQIKVCLLSSDAATVPKIKNLRINAVPEG